MTNKPKTDTLTRIERLRPRHFNMQYSWVTKALCVQIDDLREISEILVAQVAELEETTTKHCYRCGQKQSRNSSCCPECYTPL